MIEKVCGQGYMVIREGGGGVLPYMVLWLVLGGVPRYPLLFHCKNSFGLQNCFAAEPQHMYVSVSRSNMLKTSTFLHTHAQTQSIGGSRF